MGIFYEAVHIHQREQRKQSQTHMFNVNEAYDLFYTDPIHDPGIYM